MKRRDFVFFVLSGLFIAHALLAELIGGKLFSVWGWTLSVGVIPWPFVFITTDLVNEYFGPKAVKRLTFLTMGLILYCFGLLYACIAIPAATFSPVGSEAFSQVFGQSMWIIIGSVTAFAVSQLVDVLVFTAIRERTGGKMLWLRAMGSTVVSQLIDSFIVVGIAFGVPGFLTWSEVLNVSISNYSFKFIVAVGITPIIYLGHRVVDRYLAEEPEPVA